MDADSRYICLRELARKGLDAKQIVQLAKVLTEQEYMQMTMSPYNQISASQNFQPEDFLGQFPPRSTLNQLGNQPGKQATPASIASERIMMAERLFKAQEVEMARRSEVVKGLQAQLIATKAAYKDDPHTVAAFAFIFNHGFQAYINAKEGEL